eukprot:CAMPEP_0197029726 /NCGR_PEP_ID=MMETSP1384-20130603/9116_1 /TAXON_ID=29189 /ORGANISM="Ammonia sp." /LENGTH=481 /DNA_ID=CAMNT_0042458945 /DNA_START=43 /DNA_END=1488 /DNA_ORIENTATION=-
MESYYMWVVALLLIALSLKYLPAYLSPPTNDKASDSDAAEPLTMSGAQRKEEDAEHDAVKLKEFAHFQKFYIVIFLLVMLADWMQGPYVYKLYASYGIDTREIAILFVIGFGTSGITGAFIGSFADKFGRKFMCSSFCVLYAICCATKHFHDYSILLLGRFLGGISTSILFSCFESWMVTHHHHRGYPANKLGDTFGKAWSLNSFIAILAGIITSYAVSYYEHHEIIAGGPYEIAAFDCSAVTLLVALLMINLKWRQENYGDSKVDLQQSLTNALDLFRSDRCIVLVGVIQSGFEAAMYLFVFMWTMALESTHSANEAVDGEDSGGSKGIDHGMIFAVFMEACLVGTTLTGILTKSWSSEKIACWLCLIAGVALLYTPFTNNYEVRLLMFIVFECCVGMYFPTIGSLRGQYVPDNLRATIMNIFRIPLNVIVVAVLWYIDELGLKNVFLLAAALLGVACFASHVLSRYTSAQRKEPQANGH